MMTDAKIDATWAFDPAPVPANISILQDSTGTIRRLATMRRNAESLPPMRKTGTPGANCGVVVRESARSRVLFIHERNSGKRFMIDSGADVSVIPPYSRR